MDKTCDILSNISICLQEVDYSSIFLCGDLNNDFSRNNKCCDLYMMFCRKYNIEIINKDGGEFKESYINHVTFMLMGTPLCWIIFVFLDHSLIMF